MYRLSQKFYRMIPIYKICILYMYIILVIYHSYIPCHPGYCLRLIKRNHGNSCTMLLYNVNSMPGITLQFPHSSNKTSSPRKKVFLRYISLSIGVAGIVSGIIFGTKIPSTYNEWESKISSPNQYESKKKNL